MPRSYRVYVEFDGYEKALLRKLKRELEEHARQHGKKGPSMKDVIRGCVRTAVHTVYGEDYVHKELLEPETLRRLAKGTEMDEELLGDSDGHFG